MKYLIGNKTYNDFLYYAKSLMYDKRYSRISAEEVVSEAYLKAVRYNNFTEKRFLGYIKVSLLNLVTQEQTESVLSNEKRKCIECLRILSSDNFGKWLQYGRLWRISSYCIECNRKRVKDWKDKNKERYRARINRSKRNGRKHYDTWYVRELLAHKYPRDWLKNNPDFVQVERDRLITNQMLKNKSVNIN